MHTSQETKIVVSAHVEPEEWRQIENRARGKTCLIFRCVGHDYKKGDLLELKPGLHVFQVTAVQDDVFTVKGWSLALANCNHATQCRKVNFI